MRVFVTGATGLLGNTITRQLHAQGHEVTVLVRRTPEPEVFDGLDVELLYSELVPETDTEDVRDESTDNRSDHQPRTRVGETQTAATQTSEVQASEVEAAGEQTIESAIARCDAVIHSAGLIHLGWTRMNESMQVNAEGTRRIAQACLRLGKKLVYVGTLNSIAVGSRRNVADESTPPEHAGGQIQSAYVVSKTAALQEVVSAVERGLRAVIVHPGFMLGPWDWKPSSGQMVLELARGWRLLCPSGGGSICDSRDVAAATIRAIDYDGPSGRQFILAGENWTYKKLWTEIAKHFGRRPPIMAAGPGQKFIGGLYGDFIARWTGQESYLNSAAIAMSSQFHWYSSQRAKNELGYESRDPHESLRDSVEWIRKRFLEADGAGKA